MPTRSTLRRWLGVPLVLALLLPACAHRAPDDAVAARVDALVSPLVEARQFSGAVVLMRGGQVVFERGFGLANQAAALPFRPDTPNDGASLAKTFTAAGLALLVHEGLIALDMPVQRLLPEYPHAQTTVRQLLSHSNGLPPYYEFFDPHFGKDEVRTTRGLLAVVAREQPAPSFTPGTRFEYSNLGFDSAALLIERITGQDYEAFVVERFFKPLGMHSSFARPGRLADWRGVRTPGYRWRNGAWQDFDAFDNEAFLGASNLYFSARDLGRWASAFAGGRALPAAVLAAGQQRPLIAGQASAINLLSWYCDGANRRCWYSGSYNAFHSVVYWDRARDESVVYVSNSTLPPWPAITLARGLVDALAGAPAPTIAPPTFERFDRDSRPRIAGTYRADGIGRITVDAAPQGMTLRVDNGLAFDLFPVTREDFYVPGLDWFVRFSGGTTPTTLHLRSMLLDATARR
jgi:CubicO group peptidase (beta-lactamase class C family)